MSFPALSDLSVGFCNVYAHRGHHNTVLDFHAADLPGGK